jgi:hypothetical protein
VVGLQPVPNDKNLCESEEDLPTLVELAKSKRNSQQHTRCQQHGNGKNY